MKSKEEIILEAVVGMKHSEWRKIVHCIERKFADASCRVEFTQKDAEGAKYLIELERG